jgi:uncharacterized protein (DUF2147 family)
MNQCFPGLIGGLIAAALEVGAAGATGAAAAQVSRPDEVMPLTTKYPPEAIVGEWCTQTEENRPPARVRFERAQDGTYTGILSWSSAPKKDIHNKNPKLRDRSVVGIVLMWNLRYDDGEYVDGYVYNPEDGGTYSVKTELASTELLKVRGYLGISLFGETKTWTRYHHS